MRRKALKICLILLNLLLLSVASVEAQPGFSLRQGARKMSIPFERYNNLVVIPVTINDKITLRFILDSGVQSMILTEKGFADLLNLRYDRKINLSGPGVKDSINALVANFVDVKLPGLYNKKQTLLVLEEDYLNLRNNLGVEVFGIIGYDLFKRFVVEIDFDDNILTFYEPDFFVPKKNYRRIEMNIEGSKPYISVKIKHDTGKKTNSKLMVDTGASHAVLLEPNTDLDINLPGKTLETSLGRGLGGEIDGKVGRTENLEIDRFGFDYVLASYPNEGAYNRDMEDGRNGTMGGEILTRFNPVFDYFTNTLYLRKSDEYTKSFEHDMSGLEFTTVGENLDQILVTEVRPDTPGKEAGVLVGDTITHVNGHPVGYTNVNYINTLFRLRPKKKIKLKIIRGEEPIKIKFRLRRMI